MADSKITALAALTTADPANDMFPVVDVSDTSMAASGTTKRISINNILACSPSATLASATITGDLTVDTSTLKVDSTNNRVGIGTTNTFKPLTVQAGSTGAATINQGLVINSSAAYGVGQGVSYSSLVFSRNRSIDTSSLNASAEIFGGNVSETSGDGGFLGFRTQNAAGALTDRALFNSTGAFVLAGGTTTANGIGVAFPATQSASSDANCLDDYEEGTFTPTIVGQTTAGVGVYSNQVGKYTKVGNIVTVEFLLAWTAHTGTGNMLIGGLPFNASSLANLVGAAAIGYIDGIAVNAGSIPLLYVLNGGSSIAFVQTPTGGGAVATVPIDVAGTIVVTATYQA